jgi:periodic tryptophan protein 2
LHSKNLTEAGPINEEAAPDEFDGRTRSYIPGAKRGDDGSRKSKVEVLSRQLSFSSTGREWAVVSGEGLHVFSLDDDMIFDPISLSEAITPDNIEQKLAKGDHSLALRMALHLNEYELVKTVIEETPYKTIPLVVRSVGTNQVESLMQIIGKITEDSPHIEFYVEWCLQLLQIHGIHIDKNRGQFMRALRAMHRVLTTKHDDLNVVCTTNKYALSFLHDHATLLANERKQEVAMEEG